MSTEQRKPHIGTGGLIKILKYFDQQLYPFHRRTNCDPESKSSNPMVILCFRGDVRSRIRVNRLSTVSVLPRFWNLYSTGMWQGSRDPEVGKRSEKRAPPPTDLPGSQPRSLALRFCTHPPLGERKSVSSSSTAPNIAPPFAPLRGGSRRVSRDFQRRRRKMPRRRAAFRQDELSHGYWAGRRLGSGEGGAKANERAWRARPDE